MYSPRNVQPQTQILAYNKVLNIVHILAGYSGPLQKLIGLPNSPNMSFGEQTVERRSLPRPQGDIICSSVWKIRRVHPRDQRFD